MHDDLVLESHVAEWREKTFVVRHIMRRGDEVLLDGTELRAWVVKHPDDPRRFQALPIPEEIRAALS
jgi:4-hydroxybenzoyl-CoA thioesterase